MTNALQWYNRSATCLSNYPYYSHYSYCDSADAGRCSWRRWLVQLQRQTCDVASVSCLVRVLPSLLLRQSQFLPIKGTLGWWLMIQQIGQRWNPVRAKPSTTTEWQRLPSGRDQRWAMNVKAPKMVTENQRQRSDGQQAPRFMACGTTRFSTSSSYSSKKGFRSLSCSHQLFLWTISKKGEGDRQVFCGAVSHLYISGWCWKDDPHVPPGHPLCQDPPWWEGACHRHVPTSKH